MSGKVTDIEARVIIENAMGINYSDEQWEVVKDTNRPVSVVSCAGSGKTTVLIARLLYKELVEGIKPYKMLVITFNKKASEEIEGRYRRAKVELGSTSFSPSFHTFHAFFLRLLRSDEKYEDYEVTNANNYLFALSDIVRNVNTMGTTTDLVKDILSTRSSGINNKKDYLTHNEYGDKGREVILKYEELLEENNELDFDDMLILLYREIFEHHNENILNTFKESYDLVLIDEFQDISGIQYDIIETLVNEIGMDKLTSIGDDDQSIYQFRGSNPKYITQFGNMIPSAKTHLLTVNYRCPQKILEFVAPSIYHNEKRVNKSLRSSKEGGEVQFLGVNDSEALVESIKQDYIETQDVAVLVRNNHQKTVISDQLVRAGLPVNMGTTMYTLKNNQVFKRLMSFIEMVRTSNNFEFEKYYWMFEVKRRHGTRIKSRYRVGDLYWVEDVLDTGMWGMSKYHKDNIEAILDTEDAEELLRLAMRYLRGSFERGSAKGFYRMGAVEDYYTYIVDTVAKGLTYAELKEQIESMQLQLDRNMGNSQAIQVVTMHTVKGLEYDSVIVYDPSDNEMFPEYRWVWEEGARRVNESVNNYKTRLFNYDVEVLDSFVESVNSRDGEQVTAEDVKDRIEDERRLFYVACTRAMKRLTIATDANRRSTILLEALSKRGTVEIPVDKVEPFKERSIEEVEGEIKALEAEKQRLEELRQKERVKREERRSKGLADLESLLGNKKSDEEVDKTMSLGSIDQILGMGDDE